MIGKLLNDLIEKYDIDTIEKHLVYHYVSSNNLLYDDSSILKKYFIHFEFNMEIYFSVYNLDVTSVKSLEKYLELLIPNRDRKLNGAFFTPEYIIDFIVAEIKPKEDDTNLDPSCGCGAFLIGILDYYKKKYKKSIRKTVRENLFGADILPYNVERAKLILTLLGLENGEYLEEGDFNIYCHDSLNVVWSRSFDNIFGNPPYVKFQDLDEITRQTLSRKWLTLDRGTFNLYYAFFELGYALLNEGGKLGYITPNSYFTSLAGESIRSYFLNNKCIYRIIDFSHKKVFDAQTYTAITFITKTQNEIILYDRIKDNYTPEQFLNKANGSPNSVGSLNSKKWRLLKTDEQGNIKSIETCGVPIGDIFDINVGIATLKDEIYFIDKKSLKDGFYHKERNNIIFKIEKQVVSPVYKISDLKTQDDVDNNTKLIICPYNIKGKTAIPIQEEEFRIKYPYCYEYLLSEKENLIKRDKGKVIYDPFYVWGRTQGIARKGIKILTPTFSRVPRFILSKDKEAYFTNGYGIYIKNARQDFALSKIENIDVLIKILNSIVMQYYIAKTSVTIDGGYYCYQKNFIERFSIPYFSVDDIQFIRELKSNKEIDEFIINKYQLNFPVPKRLS